MSVNQVQQAFNTVFSGIFAPAVTILIGVVIAVVAFRWFLTVFMK